MSVAQHVEGVWNPGDKVKGNVPVFFHDVGLSSCHGQTSDDRGDDQSFTDDVDTSAKSAEIDLQQERSKSAPVKRSKAGENAKIVEGCKYQDNIPLVPAKIKTAVCICDPDKDGEFLPDENHSPSEIAGLPGD